MFNILKYELKKIFCNKFVIIALIAAVIAGAALPISSYVSLRKFDRPGLESLYYLKDKPNIVMNEKTYNEFKAKIKEIEADNNNYDFDGSRRIMSYCGRFEMRTPSAEEIIAGANPGVYNTLSPEDRAILNKYPEICLKDEVLPEYVAYDDAVKSYEEILRLIQNGKNAKEELAESEDLTLKEKMDLHRDVIYGEMSEKVKDGYVYGYSLAYRIFFDSLYEGFGSVVILILVVFGLWGVFTNEYATGADSLIFSSRYGRKRKNTTAKLLASLIYVISSVTAVAGVALLTCFILGGVKGANVSVRIMLIGVYPITMLQSCLILTALFAAGALIIGAITLLVSSMITNPAVSVGISALITVLPLLIIVAASDAVSENVILEQLLLLTPFGITNLDPMKPFELFYLSGKLYDIKLFVPIVTAISVIVALPICEKVFRKHQVGK